MMSFLKKYFSFLIALLLVVLLFWVLQQQIFSDTQHASNQQPPSLQDSSEVLTFEQIEQSLLEKLPLQKQNSYKQLQKALANQATQLLILGRLQAFWKDSVRIILPYYHYLGQEALLTKHEPSLMKVGAFFL